MTVDTQVHTAEELLDLPDDGHRYELVRGELRKMSPAGENHGDVAMILGGDLHAYVRAHGLGKVYAAETGFLIARNPDTVLAPDVAFVRAERRARSAGFFQGAPDLVVEVISPNDRYSQVDEKTRSWLRAGVSAVIVVDPRLRTVRVYRTSGVVDVDDVLEVQDLVPGWRIAIADLFE